MWRNSDSCDYGNLLYSDQRRDADGNTKTHPNKKLQELWNTYGADCFDCFVYKVHEYDDPSENQIPALNKLLDQCLEENPDAECIWRAKRH